MNFEHPDTITYWFATLTYVNGLTTEHLDKAKTYFNILVNCLASHETGLAGNNDHIHAIFTHTKNKGDHIRRILFKEIYGLTQRQITQDQHYMCRVEKVKNVNKTIRYIMKDVVGDPFVKCGFTKTWIDAQLKKSFDETSFYKKWKYVKTDQAPGCILEYSKLNNIKIYNKTDFIEIITELSPKINVRSWGKDMEWIYAQVMLEVGDKTAIRSWVSNKLNFIG